jgi:NADH dehydrogenase
MHDQPRSRKLKKQLIIIGGGFAGFWSAISAIRQSREIKKRDEVDIILINPNNQVTIRPRLSELSLNAMRFELDKYLKPLGIHQITGRAEIIDPENNEVIISTEQGNRNLKYDFLILAAGGSLQLPNLPGIHYAFNVDTLGHVQSLEDHIIDLAKKDFNETGATTFVVVGSEFTGLEVATTIEQKARTIHAFYSGRKSSFKVLLLETGNQPVPLYSKECRQYIDEIIAFRHIEVIPEAELTAIELDAVFLRNGVCIPTRTVIWTRGMTTSSLTYFFKSAKDEMNRLTVDQFLRLSGYENVIAVGKVAHDSHFAQFEGRWAGHNAINDLFNLPLKEYVQPDYINCIDLGEPAASYATNGEQDMQWKRYEKRKSVNYINSVTMYPWQDIEETVKESFPEIPQF